MVDISATTSNNKLLILLRTMGFYERTIFFSKICASLGSAFVDSEEMILRSNGFRQKSCGSGTLGTPIMYTRWPLLVGSKSWFQTHFSVLFKRNPKSPNDSQWLSLFASMSIHGYGNCEVLFHRLNELGHLAFSSPILEVINVMHTSRIWRWICHGEIWDKDLQITWQAIRDSQEFKAMYDNSLITLSLSVDLVACFL